jgi:hypothetical protein
MMSDGCSVSRLALGRIVGRRFLLFKLKDQFVYSACFYGAQVYSSGNRTQLVLYYPKQLSTYQMMLELSQIYWNKSIIKFFF